MTVHFPFDNTYVRLPDRFFARLAPTPVRAANLIRLNRELAIHLGFDPDRLASPEGIEVLAATVPPMEPSPSPWPMLGTSSDSSSRNSGMGAPSFWARLSIE